MRWVIAGGLLLGILFIGYRLYAQSASALSNSKLQAYGVLNGASENNSKLQAYGVLNQADMRASKLQAYAVLMPPQGLQMIGPAQLIGPTQIE